MTISKGGNSYYRYLAIDMCRWQHMASLWNLTCFGICWVVKYIMRKRNSVVVIVTRLWLQPSGVRISVGMIDFFFIFSKTFRLPMRTIHHSIQWGLELFSGQKKKKTAGAWNSLCDVDMHNFPFLPAPNNKNQVFRKFSTTRLAGGVTYFP